MASRVRSELRFQTGVQAFPCLIEHCKALDPQLATAITKPQLTITAYWGGRPDINLVHVLHVARGGGPTFRLLPVENEDKVFLEEHAACITDNKALVVHINASRQLFLAPMRSITDDGKEISIFWGYMAAPRLPVVVTELLDRAQLALILDLDETLLVAHSASSIESRMDSCRRARTQALSELSTKDGTLSVSERERLEASAATLLKEEELLSMDADLIRQFTNNGYVKVNGKMFTPRLEPAYLEDGTVIQRPVIRLKDGLLILTRIDPQEKKTSMLLHVRPGWEDMRKYLAGEVDGKQRFNVYVCTAAERQYALEVWRLLDTGAALIPQDQRRDRIVNVSGGRKKTILNSLGLTETAPLGQDHPDGPVDSVLPLAVVVDDRLEVWEDEDQANILQVMPWFHYKDEAARLTRVNTVTASFSEKELVRVRNAIVSIRGEVYQVLDQVVKPTLTGMFNEGVPEIDQAQRLDELLPVVKSSASLLKDASWCQTYGLPKLSSSSSTPPPEDAGTSAAYAALVMPAQPVVKPSDPRTKRVTKQPSGTGPSLKPADPRSRLGSREPSGPPPPTTTTATSAPAPAPAIQDLSAWTLDALQEDAGDDDVAAEAVVTAPAPAPAAAGSDYQGMAELLGVPPEARGICTADVLNKYIQELAASNPQKGHILFYILKAVSEDQSLKSAAEQVLQAYEERPDAGEAIAAFLSQNGPSGLQTLADAMAMKRAQASTQPLEGVQQSLGVLPQGLGQLQLGDVGPDPGGGTTQRGSKRTAGARGDEDEDGGKRASHRNAVSTQT